MSFTYPDATTDFVSASPSVASQSSGTLTWNVTNLLPTQTQQFEVTLNLNSPTETPALNPGDQLAFTTSVTATPDDTPDDNAFSFTQNVVNSYDPNDKTCVEGNLVGLEKVGDYVHYVIRFENTGSYSAQNIRVADAIDTSKYDVASLIPISGSAPFSTKITDGNLVEFYFENINLPFDDANNDGYVSFKIKLQNNLVSGDSFSNSANIYFDYNAAITTDAAVTWVEVLSTTDFPMDDALMLYPVPANDVWRFHKKTELQIQSVSVYGISGRLVRASAGHNPGSVDLSGLTSGQYQIRLETDKGTSAKMIQKQ